MKDKLKYVIWTFIFLLTFEFNFIIFRAFDDYLGYLSLIAIIIIVPFYFWPHRQKAIYINFFNGAPIFFIIICLLQAGIDIANGRFLSYKILHLLTLPFVVAFVRGDVINKSKVKIIYLHSFITGFVISISYHLFREMLPGGEWGMNRIIGNPNIFLITVLLCVTSLFSKAILQGKSIALFVVIAVFFFSWHLESMIGILLGLIILMYVLNKHIASRTKVFFLIISILVGSFAVFFSVNSASITGRLLIWKISLLNLPTWGLWGIGTGNFHQCFPYWQFRYFNERDWLNASEYLRADLPFAVYNDQFQLLIEHGLFVYLPFAYFLIQKVVVPATAIKPNLKLALVLSISASFFSYLLESFPLMLLFTMGYSYLTAQLKQNELVFRLPIPRLMIYTFTLASGCLLIILCCLSFTSNDRNEKDWFKGKLVNSIFKDKYVSYAFQEIRGDDPLRGQLLIEKLPPERRNYQIYLVLAVLHEQKKQYYEAISLYDTAESFIPKRLYPNVKVAEILLRTGDTLAAANYAKEKLRKTAELTYPRSLVLKHELEVIASFDTTYAGSHKFY